MKKPVSDVAFTKAVKAVQERLGSRQGYAGMEARGGWSNVITDDLSDFIGQRDSFYLGTASSDGQPYIQHRGGPPGFLKVLDEKTLGFADYRGNRQYISMGNLGENDRVYLFLMDYPNKRRIKIWGHAEVVEDDADLLARLADPEYKAVPERAFLIHLTAWDVNCPQHITPRFTSEELKPQLQQLIDRVTELETELSRLRADSANEATENKGVL